MPSLSSLPYRQGRGGTISDMLSSMEIERPRLTPVLTEKDLGFVLEALAKPPYEPLWGASLKLSTISRSSSWPWLQWKNLANFRLWFLVQNTWALVLCLIFALSLCLRIRNLPKLTNHRTSQRSLGRSSNLILLNAPRDLSGTIISL